jgi:hypothetical protein
VWHDELYTLYLARLPVAELLEALRADSGPPLHYLICRLLFTIVGWPEGAALGTFVVRLPSVAAFAVMPWLLRRIRPAEGGGFPWASLLVVSWLPLFYFGTEARAYAVLALANTVVWVLGPGWLARGGFRAFCFAATAAALPLLHYTGYVSLAVLPLLAFFIPKQRRRGLWLALGAASVHALATLAGERRLRARELVLVVLAISASIYADLSALLLIPMALLIAGWGTNSMKNAVIRSGAVLLGSLLLTLPLWIVRTHAFGSPLGLSTSHNVRESGLAMLLSSVRSLASPWRERMTTPWVTASAFLLVLVGLMSLLFAWRVRKDLLQHLEQKQLVPVLILWGTGTITVLAGWVVRAMVSGTLDPQFLLPGAPGLAVLVGWPLWTIADPRREYRLGWGLFLLLLLPYLSWLGS